MKNRTIAIAVLMISAPVVGSELTTQVGDIVVSQYSHTWVSDFTQPDGDPGGGDLFDLDGDMMVTSLSNSDTDGFDYGAEGGTHLETNASFGDSASELLLNGPENAGELFEIHGYANVFNSEYSGEVIAGTGAFAPQPVFVPWTLLIEPGPGESIGDPVEVIVHARVVGSLGANGVDSSALAEWRVVAGGNTVLDDSSFAAKGGDQFDASNTLTFETTIGSSFDVEALYRIQVFGESSITGADSVGRFTTTLVTVSLRDPRCDADLNLDGVVDTADLGVLLSMFSTGNPIADINGDGVVDTADLGLFVAAFGLNCP